jgi:hypothetical protein
MCEHAMDLITGRCSRCGLDARDIEDPMPGGTFTAAKMNAWLASRFGTGRAGEVKSDS